MQTSISAQTTDRKAGSTLCPTETSFWPCGNIPRPPAACLHSRPDPPSRRKLCLPHRKVCSSTESRLWTEPYAWRVFLIWTDKRSSGRSGRLRIECRNASRLEVRFRNSYKTSPSLILYGTPVQNNGKDFSVSTYLAWKASSVMVRISMP